VIRYNMRSDGPLPPVMDAFHAWLLEEQGRHPPRGAMGEAIGYALGQWDALTLFLTDQHLPIDNNASERALRVAALGRKNFLFVGTDEAGENLAGLYSLIATCEANEATTSSSACRRTQRRGSTNCCRTYGLRAFRLRRDLLSLLGRCAVNSDQHASRPRAGALPTHGRSARLLRQCPARRTPRLRGAAR
jgi:hypothetical protein